MSEPESCDLDEEKDHSTFQSGSTLTLISSSVFSSCVKIIVESCQPVRTNLNSQSKSTNGRTAFLRVALCALIIFVVSELSFLLIVPEGVLVFTVLAGRLCFIDILVLLLFFIAALRLQSHKLQAYSNIFSAFPDTALNLTLA